MESSPPPLGLTLAFFHEFIRRSKIPLEGLTTKDVCRELVKPYTLSTKQSLVNHVLADPVDSITYLRPASWYVSHAWSYLFLDTVQALDTYFDEKELDPSTEALWFCVFNVNQHDVVSDDAVDFEEIFRTTLGTIRRMVMVVHPWNDPITLTRIWCIYEVYLATLLEGGEFQVAMATPQKRAFLDDVRSQSNAFFDMLGKVRSERARATKRSDQARIVQLIDEQIGFTDLDNKIFGALSGWMFNCVLQQSVLPNTTLVESATWCLVVGALMCDADREEEAEKYLLRALDLFQDSIAACKASMYIARVRAGRGEPRINWENLLIASMKRQSHELGRAHPDTLNTMYELGFCYCDIGEFDQAAELLTEVVIHRTNELGEGHYDTTIAMSLLGYIYLESGELDEALKWLQPSYDLQLTHLGDDHPATGRTMNNLALCYDGQGRYDLALPLYRKAHETSRRVFGEKHPSTEASWDNLHAATLRSRLLDSTSLSNSDPS
ncbi:unnamed protein product [Aphanomyces euteiches]|nr:hypothetical protein AeRB84_001689 [Aphanomyces euteiches]